jgi:hypothetical protein
MTPTIAPNVVRITDVARRISAAFLRYPRLKSRRSEVMQQIAKLFNPPFDIAQTPPVAGVALRGSDEIVVFVTEHVKLIEAEVHKFFGSEELFLHQRYTGPFLPAASGGDSIGYGSANGETGTLGCIVTDSGGDDYLLSCNHVIADLNIGKLGIDPVWHPGAADGGSISSRAGLLHDFERIVLDGVTPNSMDAAIAKPDSTLTLSNAIRGGIGIVGGTDTNPGYNIAVKKYGKQTKLTHGDLIFHTISLVMPFAAGDAYFTNQYGIVDDTGGVFAEAGDSGSLVVNASSEAVGLLFGVAGTGDIAVANPIDPILTRFGVYFR